MDVSENYYKPWCKKRAHVPKRIQGGFYTQFIQKIIISILTLGLQQMDTLKLKLN